MKKSIQSQLVFVSVQSVVFMVLGLVFMLESVYASPGGGDQPLPIESGLLQLRAGDHIMGFQPGKVYLVNTTGFLSVDFIHSHAVAPIVTMDGFEYPQNTALTQGGADTLASLQRVEYPEIWDGISLRYDAISDGIAESSYFVQPGADVADIRFRYNGVTELQADGSLKISFTARQGYITESHPIAWQVIDGSKKPVQVAYEIVGQTIGFRTGAYDRAHELIIDPTYQWHSFFGSAFRDSCMGITLDSSGNVYMTGYSDATWNGPSGQAPVNAHSGNYEIVIIKLDSSGGYQWHTFHGSADRDYSYGISLDSLGNVYVAGESQSTWGSPVGGNIHKVKSDMVVVKLSNAGEYQWHTFHGSEWAERSRSIAIDSNDNIYVSGATVYAWDGPDGQAPVNPFSNDINYELVVIKLSSSGEYQWHTFHGSAKWLDQDWGIVVDNAANVYVTGWSAATWDGPDSGAGAVPPIHAYTGASSSEDIVVLKLNSSGVYQWHTFHGSSSRDNGLGIAIDDSSNIYVTGWSESTWNGPSGEEPLNGSGPSVVLKLDSSGAYQWHTFHGSSVESRFNGIALDNSSNVYLGGESYAWQGPSGKEPLNAHSGGSDIGILKLNSSGAYQWHTFYGTALSDTGTSVALDSSSNIYVGGYGNATWNGPGIAEPLNPYNADYDIVVLKLNGKSALSISRKGLGTVTSAPAGIGCGPDCTEIYDDGTAVTLTAVSEEPDSGFVRWDGGCGGRNTTTITTINGDMSCRAVFRSFPWPAFLTPIIYTAQQSNGKKTESNSL